jgi:hypothetical protein
VGTWSEPGLRAAPRPRAVVAASAERPVNPVGPARRLSAVPGTWSAPELRPTPRPRAEEPADRVPVVAPAALLPVGADRAPVAVPTPLPVVAFVPRPKNCDPEDDRERLRANGLSVSVEEAPPTEP